MITAACFFSEGNLDEFSLSSFGCTFSHMVNYV